MSTMDVTGNNVYEPLIPRSVEETGLSMGLLSDLALKVLYFESYMTGRDLALRMGLPFPNVVSVVLEFLRREKLCEVRSATGRGGFSESTYEYVLTSRGRDMSRDALERGQYIGTAPVPLAIYITAILAQSLKDVVVHQKELRKAVAHLVFNEATFEQIGPAINSGRSIFLFGGP
ncbi:MAG: ATP-binding protein, partial [Anaerolineales bacterium]